MKTVKNIKSKVMKAAWTIYRKYKNATMANWSKALKRAWKWAKDKLYPKPERTVLVTNIAKETAKAICATVQVVCVHTDNYFSKDIWIPKSLMRNDEVVAWFASKKESEILSTLRNPQGKVIEW